MLMLASILLRGCSDNLVKNEALNSKFLQIYVPKTGSKISFFIKN